MSLWPVGALWERRDKRNDLYFTGHIESELPVEVVHFITAQVGDAHRIYLKMFPNSKKRFGDNKPELLMYISED